MWQVVFLIKKRAWQTKNIDKRKKECYTDKWQIGVFSRNGLQKEDIYVEIFRYGWISR